MFLQQADTNGKNLLCLHRNAHSATNEAVGDMPPPSGAQQSMIPIGSLGPACGSDLLPPTRNVSNAMTRNFVFET